MAKKRGAHGDFIRHAWMWKSINLREGETERLWYVQLWSANDCPKTNGWRALVNCVQVATKSPSSPSSINSNSVSSPFSRTQSTIYFHSHRLVPLALTRTDALGSSAVHSSVGLERAAASELYTYLLQLGRAWHWLLLSPSLNKTIPRIRAGQHF